jgi:hypothetical protein
MKPGVDQKPPTPWAVRVRWRFWTGHHSYDNQCLQPRRTLLELQPLAFRGLLAGVRHVPQRELRTDALCPLAMVHDEPPRLRHAMAGRPCCICEG